MSRSRAFTLVELLVVVAVITILAAILFPTFSSAREKARSSVCISNLKQIGRAYLMYADDHDELFPLAVQAPDRRLNVYWSPPNVVPWSSQTVNVRTDQGISHVTYQSMYETMGANVLFPYTRSYEIWACPSTVLSQQFPGDPVYQQFTPGVKPTEISYQFNGLLGALSTSNIRHPSEVPMVWEGPENRRFLGSNINNPGVGFWTFSKLPHPWTEWPFRQADCTTGLPGTMYTSWNGVTRVEIHHGGQNWLYADGHVRWKKLGGTGNTDPWQDPFNYYPDGNIRINWADECDRPWLFRPDYEPSESEPGGAVGRGISARETAYT